MKFSLWTKYGARNSGPVFEAFRQSIVSAGHSVDVNDPDADVDVIWSVLWKGAMAQNESIFRSSKPTIVLEVGGIIRGTTWKVGLNGISRSCLHTPQGNDGTRAKQLGLELKQWTGPAEHILICCQNPKSELWKGLPSPSDWVNNAVRIIRTQSDRHIVIRAHPRAPLRAVIAPSKNITFQKPTKITGTYDDFDLAFKDVHAVINWSSNPGPQAIVHGVPAFVGSDSLAYDVANKNLLDIEAPIMPDREQWFNDYAYTEYTTEEIAQGVALNNIFDALLLALNN